MVTRVREAYQIGVTMFIGTFDGSITVACAQRDTDDDYDEEEDQASAQYTQHQALKKQETTTWWG